MLNRITVPAVVFTLSFPVLAQLPSDTIDPGFFNIGLIESLVSRYTDSVRVKRNAGPLEAAETLVMAARDHASFLAGRDNLTHIQPGRKKKTPADRIIFYGGKASASGEIILSTFIEDSGTGVNFTYSGIAKSMLKQWVYSPDHYKIMIKKMFRFSGVAAAYDPEKGLLICVQVFSDVK